MNVVENSGYSRMLGLVRDSTQPGTQADALHGSLEAVVLADWNCPACGDTAICNRREVPDHEYGLNFKAVYVVCANCKTVCQYPMPNSDQLSSFYPSDYHSMRGGGLLKQVRHSLRLRRLEAIAKGRGAWLDYGCGDGSFLVQAARRIPENEYYGFEISPRRKVFRLAGDAVTVVQGALGDLLEVLPPCRLITMNHVIEHLPDPAEVVSTLTMRLVPGGVFEGQTPNSDSLEHTIFKGNWSGYHAPRHTVVFSRRGMHSLLLSAGLTEIHVSGAFNPAGLAVSFASIFHDGAGGRIPRQGPKWLASLGMATVFAPLDLVLGPPGIINFSGWKKGN